jgi:hypothetical protein
MAGIVHEAHPGAISIELHQIQTGVIQPDVFDAFHGGAHCMTEHHPQASTMTDYRHLSLCMEADNLLKRL